MAITERLDASDNYDITCLQELQPDACYANLNIKFKYSFAHLVLKYCFNILHKQLTKLM